ncbi:unnamed protein product [Symbiodinium sp. CCMP2592]|nr:unnamed protein product [Symbiodinium sp. CCMP2592]
MKPGPRSLNDFCEWPQTALRHLVDTEDGSRGERFERLKHNLQLGLLMYSDYSGLAGEHECMFGITKALQTYEAFADHASAVRFCRFSDVGAPQQKVLQAISHLHEDKICVMGDLNDRLPPEARSLLDAMLPTEKVGKGELVKAYESMGQYLMDNRAWLFPRDAKSPCSVHGRGCFVFPQCSPPVEAPVLRRRRTKSGSAEPGLCTEPICAGTAQLRINLAGTTCCGWSSAGKSLQFADVSERPHAVWLAERRHRGEQCEEDFFVSECTPRYPVEAKLRNPLESSHDVLHIVVSATDLGWPVRRRRVFTCGLSKASMIWLGPPQEQLLDHFKSFFAAQMEATADVFLFADNADVVKELGRLAQKRGFCLCENPDTAKIPLNQMYAPGQLLRYSEYDDLRKSIQGEDLTWFADLEQNCGKGASTPGRILPSMLTHGTVHSWQAQRTLTHRELYQAHGFFMKDASSPIAKVLEQMPHSQQQMLLGNGWHLPVMGSWLLYILAHSIRINRAMSVQPERGLLRALSSKSLLSMVSASDHSHAQAED